MKQIRKILCLTIIALLFIASTFMALAQVPDTLPTNLVRMPSMEHMNDSLPPGILSWDAISKTVTVTNSDSAAHFDFTFSNISTNDLVILHVTPSCGCTTLEMPPTPWTIAPKTSHTIKAKVNIGGKSGTLFKSLHVYTDHGNLTLGMTINIVPQPVAPMTEAQRAEGIAAAKLDRQAVFKGDCASCHTKGVVGKFGKPLYDAACAICHEADPRASMVPDLHHLVDANGKPLPTTEDFWKAWITVGKEGTLMPAFTASQGGPLNEIQIASLANYLNAMNPPPTSTQAK